MLVVSIRPMSHYVRLHCLQSDAHLIVRDKSVLTQIHGDCICSVDGS